MTMRYIGLLFLFISSQMLLSQDKVSLDLDSYTEVKAYDGISVKLVNSSSNKAIISGANTQKVAIVNNDGVLKIRMEIDKLFSGYRTFVELHHAQPLLIIDVNEDARISSENKIEQDVLELKAQEGGEINVEAEVEQLLIKSVTGGIIETSGTSHNQDVSINTGGIYKGKDFKTKITTVQVNAGSTAEVYASDYVRASVKAGGEVQVYGNPGKMEEKTVFGGKITRM